MPDKTAHQKAPHGRPLWMAVAPLFILMSLLALDATIGHLLLSWNHSWEDLVFWPAFLFTLGAGGSALLSGFSPTNYSWLTLGGSFIIYTRPPMELTMNWQALPTYIVGAMLLGGFVWVFIRGWRHTAFWAILMSSQLCLISAIDVGHQADTLLWFSGVVLLTVILGYVTFNYYHNLYNPGIYLWIIGLVLLNSLVLAFVDGQLHAFQPNRTDQFTQWVILVNGFLISMPCLSWLVSQLVFQIKNRHSTSAE